MKISRDISLYEFLNLCEMGISLHHIYLLELIDDGKIIDNLPNISNFLFDLHMKFLISEDNKITLEGKELLKEVYSKEKRKIAKKQKTYYDERFLEWWELFPVLDAFDEFPGIRTMRVKKEECNKIYLSLLENIEHEKLMDALEYEIAARKDMSRIRKANQLSFMNSTHPYLNGRKFEPYLTLIKKGKYRNKSEKEHTITHNKISF